MVTQGDVILLMVWYGFYQRSTLCVLRTWLPMAVMTTIAKAVMTTIAGVLGMCMIFIWKTRSILEKL
jgi:ammonia channel protein AmtB